jgi:hypothetical protein
LEIQLKEAYLTLNNKENKFNEKIESYELQLEKYQDELKQSREKYDR